MDNLIFEHNHTARKTCGIPSCFEGNIFILEAQSGATNSMVHADNAMHQTVTTRGSTLTPLKDSISDDADISKFLQRKVKLASTFWAVGTPFSISIRPWDILLNNTFLLDKLANYSLLQADLTLTILVNGTPFHAGLVLASYSYLATANEIVVIGGDEQIVTRSQRPHCWLNVATNKSGCICVPFATTAPYLRLHNTPGITAREMGELYLDSVADLTQINGGTDSVIFTVFGQFSNVKLTAPTGAVVAISGSSTIDTSSFFMVAQSVDTSKTPDDEYENSGIVSGPASAVADFAGHLTSVPYIGPLALATQIGAGAIGSIARLFGFSKPALVHDVSVMRNTPAPCMALTEGGDTSQKLTVTSKQEISIDPAILGFPSEDELTIKHMSQIESYITQFTWATSDGPETYLFAIQVTPMVERQAIVGSGIRHIPTALSFLSRPFAEWSGSLKFRFQVIGSQFHRGRLAIVYDPVGPGVAQPFNVTYNTIIDLEDCRDGIVTVDWQSDRPYLSNRNIVGTVTDFYTTASPASETARDYSNGVLYAYVINTLVVPDGATPVQVAVSISAGDDFELVNPQGDNMQIFPYLAQAASGSSDLNVNDFFMVAQASAAEITPVEENAPEGENDIPLTTNVMTNPQMKPLIYYGERITSIRQLLKRYSFWRTIGLGTTPTTNQSRIHMVLKQMPVMGGWDPNGADFTTPSSTPYWYCSQSYLTYFKQFFAFWRGSIRYKMLPNSEMHSMSVARMPGSFNSVLATDLRPTVTRSLVPTDSTNFQAYRGMENAGFTPGGMARTQNKTMDALEFEIPYTLPIRASKTYGDFSTVNTNSAPNGYPGGSTYSLTMVTAGEYNWPNIDTYCAAGEDFSLMGRVGAPVMYWTPLPAAAV